MIFAAHVINFTYGKKGGGMFCHGTEGEEEKAEEDSNANPDYKDKYDHGDNWDPEELLGDSDDKEEESINNDKEEDGDRYTSERVYLNHINNLEGDVDDDDNSVEDEGED